LLIVSNQFCGHVCEMGMMMMMMRSGIKGGQLPWQCV